MKNYLTREEVNDLEKYFNGFVISEKSYLKLYDRFMKLQKIDEKPRYSNGEVFFLDDFITEYVDNFLELV